MKELEERRVCVKFCYKLAKMFTETFHVLKVQSSQRMEKGSPRQKKKKKSANLWVKKQGVFVYVFLIVKALSIMNLYHVVRW